MLFGDVRIDPAYEAVAVPNGGNLPHSGVGLTCVVPPPRAREDVHNNRIETAKARGELPTDNSRIAKGRVVHSLAGRPLHHSNVHTVWNPPRTRVEVRREERHSVPGCCEPLGERKHELLGAATYGERVVKDGNSHAAIAAQVPTTFLPELRVSRYATHTAESSARFASTRASSATLQSSSERPSRRLSSRSASRRWAALTPRSS